MPVWCNLLPIHSAMKYFKKKKQRVKRLKEKLIRTATRLNSPAIWNRTGTVKNDVAHYGIKEHASVDVKHGFVLSTEMTPASHHDSPYLPLCVAGSRHTKEPIKKVYADKGYFGKPNREFLLHEQY